MKEIIRIAQMCYDIAKELDVEPYDEHTGKGCIAPCNRSYWTIWMDGYSRNRY